MTPTHIVQCEGCASPLCYYYEEWQRGEIVVTWELCGMHEYEAQVSPHILNADFDDEE